MTILDKIAMRTKERRVDAKREISLDKIKDMAISLCDAELPMNRDIEYAFERALKSEDIAFICEVKKASPSKGLIAKEFNYIEIAKEYEKAGASAISVLTEPYYFQGDNTYLTEIKENVCIPVLRKDFIVDEYQIYEAKVIGADAILLICAILSEEQLITYHQLAKSLKMDVLVEAHDEKEVRRAIEAGARIIGVNNRDLRTFQVDITNSRRLREIVPSDIIFVSESGISSAEDIAYLRENGTNAVLIGETLMRSNDKGEMLDNLRG